MKFNNLKEIEVSMAKRSWRDAINRLNEYTKSIEDIKLSRYTQLTESDINDYLSYLKCKRKNIVKVVIFWKKRYQFYQVKVNKK